LQEKEPSLNIPFRRYWDLLARYIQPQKNRFILLTVLLLSSIGLQVVNPQIMRFFIDTATGGKEASILVKAAAAFIGIALVQQVVGVSATYLGENVAWTATNALRAELARPLFSSHPVAHTLPRYPACSAIPCGTIS
jgi:ATP-binding cassette subfamily B protein